MSAFRGTYDYLRQEILGALYGPTPYIRLCCGAPERLRVTRTKLVLLLAFSAIGLVTSAFVIWQWYIEKHTLPACGSGQLLFGWLQFNCARVLGSTYSTVLGVPLEIFALVYFIVNLALVWAYAFGSDRLSHSAFRALFGWRFLGIILVPYLMFVEFVLLHAICIYCTTMHAAIIVDFVVITYLLFWKHEATPPILAGELEASEIAGEQGVRFENSS